MNEDLTERDPKADLLQAQDTQTEADPKNEQLLKIGKRLTESLKTLSGKEPNERYVAARQLVDVMMESLRLSELDITPEVVSGLQVATDQMSYEMFKQRVEQFLTGPLNLTTLQPGNKFNFEPNLLTPMSPLDSAQVMWRTNRSQVPTGDFPPIKNKIELPAELLTKLEEIEPLHTLPNWRPKRQKIETTPPKPTLPDVPTK